MTSLRSALTAGASSSLLLLSRWSLSKLLPPCIGVLGSALPAEGPGWAAAARQAQSFRSGVAGAHPRVTHSPCMQAYNPAS